MGADDLPVEAYIKTGAHFVVMSTGERAQGYRVHFWCFEGSIQSAAAPLALHGKRLEHVPIQNRQHCMVLLRIAQHALEARRP